MFTEVFPQLAQARAHGDLQAQKHQIGYGQFTRQQYTREYLEEVREASLVFLYRLLFLLYAEDRDLLPVADKRYQPYSVRRLRDEVSEKVDANLKWLSPMPKLWRSLQGVFTLVDRAMTT